MSSRDPFSSPKLENEFSLSGFRPQLRQTCKKPTHLAQTEEPWSRLYDRATLASTRRSVMSDELQAPNDSLDFHLNSVYDHNKDLFYKKNQTLYQKESVSEDHRKHENENLQQTEEKDIIVWVDPQRRSIHSIK
ncbi:protein C1orf194 homolog [Hippoglossus hippoglossus]|uniref:protein C1orf194 homolog n=1 Tax=Hippoglossus hippoglossus TaxID=8267 RepID=UPI00148E3178|nr:protein C1orf194 homolog [Hippoglossus hippoglossus]